MSKDLRIEFKFKNAILLTRLQEKFGEDASTKSMAEAMGVAYTRLICLLTLNKKPFSSKLSRGAQSVDGVIYSKDAMQIANFLDFTEPAELFPVSLYALKIPKKYHKDFESIQLLSFQEAREQKLLPPVEGYEDNYEALGLKERMNQLLGTLTAREEKVIRMRFGLDGEVEHTLEETAAAFKVSRERLRQIEKKALKQMRHPARAKMVKAFYTGEEPPAPEPVEFIAEIIQNRIQGRVKPEVREAVQARVKELEPLPMERWADPREDPDLYPDPLTEKRRLVLVAKLARLKKIKEYSDRPGEKLFKAWDSVLGGFRMLPYSLVVEDNGPEPTQ